MNFRKPKTYKLQTKKPTHICNILNEMGKCEISETYSFRFHLTYIIRNIYLFCTQEILGTSLLKILLAHFYSMHTKLLN